MAYNKNYGSKKRTYHKKNKSKFTELERLAYNMAKVDKGLKNPNSRVYESYHNGANGIANGKKKPLI